MKTPHITNLHTLAILIFIYYTSTITTSYALSAIAAIISIARLFISLKTNKATPFTFQYIFSFTTTLVFIFIAEHGIYFSEISENSYLTGVTVRTACLFTIFIMAFEIFYKKTNIRISPLPKKTKIDNLALRTLIALSFAAIAASIITQLNYGIPLLNGWNRFYYWKEIAPSYQQFLHLTIISTSAVFSYAYYTKKISRITLTIWATSSITALVLASEKFSGFFTMLIYWLPAMFIIGKRRLSFTKTFFLATGASIFIASTIFLNYSKTLDQDASASILSRAPLQAQMGWKLDSLADLTPKPVDVITSSFFGLSSDGKNKGIHYLMYAIAPRDVVDRFIEGGVRFTAPFPSNFTYFFGFIISPILIFAFALLPALNAAICYNSMVNKNFIYYFISSKFSIMLFTSVLMGEQQSIFTLKFAIYCFILFVTPALLKPKSKIK